MESLRDQMVTKDECLDFTENVTIDVTILNGYSFMHVWFLKDRF